MENEAMEKKTIGKFIAALRRAAGMTQRELGEKLFVSDKTVSRWECDECTPELSLLPAIAELFDISVDELLRGERRSAAERAAESEERRDAKSEKRFRLMLHERQKRFKSFSFVSIGLTVLGLIAAAICNLCFTRGLLGACLATVFFIAAAICQLLFAANGKILADEDDGESRIRDIKRLNSYMTEHTVKVLFAVFSAFVFCLPIATIPTNSYYGLTFGSWIGFALIYLAVALVFAFLIYRLFIAKALIAKGALVLDEAEAEAFKQKNAVLKKAAKVFIIVFAVLTLAIFVASALFDKNAFRDEKHFNDPDEFIAYVQGQYDEWYLEWNDELPEGGFKRSDAANFKICWAEIDGKEYYYNADLYRTLNVFEYEPNKYDITVTTYEAIYEEQAVNDTVMILLLFLQIANPTACAIWYAAKARRWGAKVRRDD